MAFSFMSLTPYSNNQSVGLKASALIELWNPLGLNSPLSIQPLSMKANTLSSTGAIVANFDLPTITPPIYNNPTNSITFTYNLAFNTLEFN